jgi:rRNA maturation protein Nop10
MQQWYSCPYCSALVVYGQKVCPNCGKKLNWPAPKKGSLPSLQNQYRRQYPEKQQSIGGYSETTPQKKRPVVHVVLPVAAFLLLTIVGIALAANGDIFNTLKPPMVKSFDVNHRAITQGQTATLQWDVSGAKSVSIDQGIGAISSAGTQSVAPITSTTYTISATNDAGSTTSSVTVIVTLKSPPVITDFTANPSSITAGESSILQWNVEGATSVSIDQGVGTVSSKGTLSITPTANTTFNLVAVNSAGSTTASAAITIVPPSPPVINDFSLDPHIVYAGKPSILQWDVMGATSVSIDQGIGTVCSAGTITVMPYVSTLYTLTATNSVSSITETAYLIAIPGQSATGLPTTLSSSPT